MKINISLFRYTFVAGLALTTSAFSATIYSSALINANGGTDDRVILSATGALMTSGYAAIGSFGGISVADVASSATPVLINTLASSFIPLGTDNFVLGNNANLGFAVPGSFIINVPQANYTTSPTLYNFIGNGATLASSTAYVLFRLNQTLAQDAPPPTPPTAYTFGMNNGILLYGTSGTFTGYNNSDLEIVNKDITSFRLLTAIPEPSSLLLGFVGLAGILRRRRI